MAFAGLDVGTSGSKMLVYDLNGNVIFKAARKYNEIGGNGRRELNPQIVIENVKKILLEAGLHCSEPIEAMAVASLGESVVCLDENDEILANSMLTGDVRGIPETKELIEKLGAQYIFETTGIPPNELYGLPKYLWLNRHTEVIKKAKAILFYEDFVGYILTGERKVSYSSAARSLAFDIRKMEWSEKLLSYAGIRKSQMSEPIAPCNVIGTILPEVAETLHLNPKMKVVVGGHDQTCAALGSGLTKIGDCECGMGTCEFMFLMLPKPMMTPYMRENDFPCSPYVFTETYLTSMEVTTCGILKNWAKAGILKGIDMECEVLDKNFWKTVEEAASKIWTEVLVLPQFGSSGNPDLCMDARGTIAGLDIDTKPEEIYRAILEGMAFQMYLSYQRLQKQGVFIDNIVVTGGGAVSELTLQIRADIFNKRVISLQNAESGAAGCMMMAAVGVGAYKNLEEAISNVVKTKKEYFPDAIMHKLYCEKYERYKRLYEKMHDFSIEK